MFFLPSKEKNENLIHQTARRDTNVRRSHSRRRSRMGRCQARRFDEAPGVDLMEIFGHLDPGDQIAVRGTDELRAGANVTVKQSPTTK
jgi:hypothetical protein